MKLNVIPSFLSIGIISLGKSLMHPDRYKEMFEQLPVASLVLDEQGVILEANSAAGTMLGSGERELVGVPFGTFVVAEEKAGFVAHLENCFSRGRQAVRKVTVLALTGREPLRVQLVSGCRRSETGDVADLLVTLAPVEKSVKVAEEAAGDAGTYQAAIGDTPVTLFLQDRELRYEWLQSGLREVRGKNAAGKTDRDFFPAEAAEHLAEIKRWVIANGVARRELVDVSFARKEGGFTDLTVFPRFDAFRQVIGVRGIAFDISDTISTENLLRRNQKRTLLAMESIPGWLLVFDLMRGVLFCNREAARALGHPEGAPAGLRDADLFPGEAVAAYRPLVEKAIETGMRQHGEAAIGCQRMDLTCVPLADGEGNLQEVLLFGHECPAPQSGHTMTPPGLSLSPMAAARVA